METKTEKTGPKILVVCGVIGSGTSFMVKALTAIIELAGFSIVERKKSDPEWDKSETDFIIIKQHEFDVEVEAKAALIFASTRNEESLSKYFEEGIYGVAKAYRELIRWMRSNKLAYCMDMDLAFNQKGLHNYNNFRFMILPMNYAFQPMKFSNVSPTAIIKRIMPEFEEKSKEAMKNMDEKLMQNIAEDHGTEAAIIADKTETTDGATES